MQTVVPLPVDTDGCIVIRWSNRWEGYVCINYTPPRPKKYLQKMGVYQLVKEYDQPDDQPVQREKNGVYNAIKYGSASRINNHYTIEFDNGFRIYTVLKDDDRIEIDVDGTKHECGKGDWLWVESSNSLGRKIRRSIY